MMQLSKYDTVIKLKLYQRLIWQEIRDTNIHGRIDKVRESGTSQAD